MNSVLTARQLNRATLARQLLLEREPMDPLLAIERLGGLRSQTPQTWYLGLWGRLHPFDPEEVGDLLTGRQAVRISSLRGEVHTLSAADALWLRPLLGPVITRTVEGIADSAARIDQRLLARAARAVLESEPLSLTTLGKRLQQRWPNHDAAVLAQIACSRLALVQIPPRGVWRRNGPKLYTTIEKWLAKPLTNAPLERLAMRYLAAYGPATAADCSAWCGLDGLDEVFARLKPDMAVFEAEDGRELLDLPDAPRPDADTPAPARLLYAHDNLLSAHADSSRFHRPSGPPPPREDGLTPGAVLLDGIVRGGWLLGRDGTRVIIDITRVGRYTRAETDAVTEEAQRLLEFAAPSAEHEVRFSAR